MTIKNTPSVPRKSDARRLLRDRLGRQVAASDNFHGAQARRDDLEARLAEADRDVAVVVAELAELVGEELCAEITGWAPRRVRDAVRDSKPSPSGIPAADVPTADRDQRGASS